MRFDAKMDISNWTRGQWAHFIILVLPGYPDYYCFMPMRSFANLHAVYRRTSKNWNDIASLDFRTSDQRDNTFKSYLALFAVYKDDIYRALTNLVDCVTNKAWYVNPTNGVEFRGWNIPQADNSFLPLLQTRQVYQRRSVDAIKRIAEFLESAPKIEMKIVPNPAEPLVCDFTLIDEKLKISYLIEHKYRDLGDRPRQGANTLIYADSAWRDERMNWHFLFCQFHDELAIHTRVAMDKANTAKTQPVLFDMSRPGEAADFAKHIRERGTIAKRRLLQKWENVDLYDENVRTIEGSDASTSGPVSSNTHSRNSRRSDIQRFAFAFANAFNRQSYKLRSDCCIMLDNDPCADAAVIKHRWDASDVLAFQNARELPVKMVGKSDHALILLKFIPHYHQTKKVSISKAFELSMQGNFEIPACSAQPFIYVATAGGVPRPNQDVDLNELVLIPSKETTMLDDSLECNTCSDQDPARAWTYVTESISNPELEKLRVVNSSKGRQVSLTQAPFLQETARPTTRLVSFSNGDVHQYFGGLFSEANTDVVTKLQGSTGLLQRQWNHGTSRMYRQATSVEK